jgi:hypothetical protein
MIVTRETSTFIPRPVVFVLEINKRPILAFEALSGRDAKQLVHEPWLQQDLKRLRVTAPATLIRKWRKSSMYHL